MGFFESFRKRVEPPRQEVDPSRPRVIEPLVVHREGASPVYADGAITWEASNTENFGRPVNDMDRPKFAEQKSVFQAGEPGIDIPLDNQKPKVLPKGMDAVFAEGSSPASEVQSGWNDPAARFPDDISAQVREDHAPLAQTLEDIEVEELTMEGIEEREQKKAA